MSAHDELGLKVLLSWAVEFVEREAEQLTLSHLDPVDGEWCDEDVRVEVADAKRWLIKAREALM